MAKAPPTRQKPELSEAEKRPERTYATNKRAHYEYSILETIEAGMELQGTEVKSIRAGNVNLRDAFARVQDGQVWLWNTHISPWDQGNRWNHEPRRSRKLLMHTREIARLAAGTHEGGTTLIPLRIYDKRGRLKIEIALAKGKKTYDKRASISERENKRELDRVIKEARAR